MKENFFWMDPPSDRCGKQHKRTDSSWIGLQQCDAVVRGRRRVRNQNERWASFRSQWRYLFRFVKQWCGTRSRESAARRSPSDKEGPRGPVPNVYRESKTEIPRRSGSSFLCYLTNSASMFSLVILSSCSTMCHGSLFIHATVLITSANTSNNNTQYVSQ